MFVGVDISARQLSVACRRSTVEVAFSVAYTAAGMETLVERLGSQEAEAERILVVVEATGNYWMSLALHLHRCGLSVSVINPAQGHYFTQALLQRGKSDPLDAKVLARLVLTLQPEAWTPPPAVYEELRQRLVERDALLDMRQQVRNQRYALKHNRHVIVSIGQRMEEHLHLLDMQIKQVEGEIQQAMTQDAAWAAAAQRLRSIPGVGLISAGWLLVATVNFSQADAPEQVVAYAGLAPQPHQSGTSLKGRASIGHSGHARLRIPRCIWLSLAPFAVIPSSVSSTNVFWNAANRKRLPCARRLASSCIWLGHLSSTKRLLTPITICCQPNP